MAKRTRKTWDVETEERLRDEGWEPCKVERQTGMIKRDLYGFADYIAYNRAYDVPRMLFIQVKSRGSIAQGIRTVLSSSHARNLSQKGHGVQVWGWDMKNDVPRLKRRVLWPDDFYPD